MPEIPITIPALREWAKAKEPAKLVVGSQESYLLWSQSCPIATYLKEQGACGAVVFTHSSQYSLGDEDSRMIFTELNGPAITRVVLGVDSQEDPQHITAAEFLSILDRAEKE